MVGVNRSPVFSVELGDWQLGVSETYVVSKDIFTDLDVSDSFTTELTSDRGAVDFMVETQDKFEFAPSLASQVGTYTLTFYVTDSNSGLCPCGKKTVSRSFTLEVFAQTEGEEENYE